MRFFEIPNEPKREKEGKVIPWNNETMEFRPQSYISSYLFIEMRAIIYLIEMRAIIYLKEILDSKKRDIEHISTKKKWIKPDKKAAGHGDILLGEWLKERKEVIADDLHNVPHWMKQAIFPQGYNEDA